MLEKASTSLGQKIKSNALPFFVCLGMLLVSILQTVYFRSDLRKLMLETGRRIKYSASSDRSEWLFGASKLFDAKTDSALLVPFMKKEESKASREAKIVIELALTHFPAKSAKAFPILRKPALVEIYNGACSECSLAEFQKHSRIKTALISLSIRELSLPVTGQQRHEEIQILQRKLLFPDRPGPQRISLEHLHFFGPKIKRSETVSLVLLSIHVLSTYPGQQSDPGVYIGEVRYADLSPLGEVHYWQ